LKTLDWDLLCSWPIEAENPEGASEAVNLRVIYPPDDEGVSADVEALFQVIDFPATEQNLMKATTYLLDMMRSHYPNEVLVAWLPKQRTQ
jgi:hypothetical protein